MAKLCVECGKEIKEETGSPYCTKCDDMLDRQFKSILDKIIINLELTENEITILNKFVKEDIIKLYLKVYKIFKEEGDFTKDQARVLNQILKTFNISENEVGKDFTSFFDNEEKRIKEENATITPGNDLTSLFDIEEKRCPYCSAEISGFTKTCGKCGKDLTGFFDNTVLFHSVINNNEEKRIKEENTTMTPAIEVRHTDGQVVGYADFKDMRQAILDGKLLRTQEARVVVYDKKRDKTGKWTNVEKIANSNWQTSILYRPIWAHTMRGMMIAWYVGFVLKVLDTAVLYFQIDSLIGLLWTIFGGAIAVSIVFKKVRWAMPAAVVVGLIAIFKGGGNLWLGALAAGIISFLVAAPFGMTIGTIVGHARRRNLPRALDAVPEGAKPYVLGIVVPLVVSAIFIPLYLLWLNPMIIRWLSK